MHVEITRRRKLYLGAIGVAICVCALAAWVESRDAAFFADAAFTHARDLTGKDDSAVLHAFGRQAEAIRKSHLLVSLYASSTLVLSFAALAILWIPARKNEPDSDVA